MLSRLYFISLDYFGQVNFASMPEVCHLFVITSTDTFLRQKLLQNCRKLSKE